MKGCRSRWNWSLSRAWGCGVTSLWVSHRQLHQSQTDALVFYELCKQGCHVAQL